MNIEKRKQTLLATLKTLGVSQIVIDYSGSGDDGQINEINAYLTSDLATPEDIDKIAAQHAPLDDIPIKVSNKLLGQKDKELSAILEEFAYDAIDAANLSDWVNNEGGGGVMTLLVEAGEDSDQEKHEAGVLSIRHYYNVETKEYESATL